MTRWWPDTVLGQMICIVFAVVFMVFALGEALEDRFDRLTSDGLDDDEYLRQVAVLAVVMRHQSAADLERDLQSLSEIGIQGRVLPAQPEALHTGRTESLNWTKVILCCPDLPAPEGVARVDGERMVLFPLATGGQLAFPQRPSGGSTGGEFLYFPLATGILVLGFSIFAIWGVSRPIGRMAASITDTDAFLSNKDPVEERGPREVRHLARTLNQMRDRIQRLLDSRNRMLRGISHDLRTPLTRLKLRVERMEDRAGRQQALSDIDQLDRMIGSTLRYLRDGSSRIDREICDMSSLLQSICDDFWDTGAQIFFEGPERLEVECSADEMMRAISNLCDNGLKFGSRVTVTLGQEGGFAIVEVADDGPGIPAEMRDKVMEPYTKLGPARSEKGGYGLGLAITAEIVAGHRGELSLRDNHPRGLRVRVALPLHHDRG